MFKKLCILLIILLLASGAYSARLVDPISKEIDTEEYVGSVSPGSTLELIFSKELGKFDSLEVNSKLPAGYKATVKDYLESIKVFVLVPDDAINDTYQMNLTLSGKVSEEIQIYFVVSDGLLDASLNNYSNEAYVGSLAEYDLTLINNSNADDEFIVSTSLPWYWLTEKGLAGNPTKDNTIKVIVPRKSTKEITIKIFPQTFGEKIFDVTVDMTPREKKEFSLKINAKQTFKTKTQNIFFGIPFYSFSLIPSFDLIGLFSLLFN